MLVCLGDKLLMTKNEIPIHTGDASEYLRIWELSFLI